MPIRGSLGFAAGFAALAAGLLGAVPVGPAGEEPEKTTTRLAIKGSQFLVNGKPTFLFGISYYAGLGAPDEVIRRDLAELGRLGFNWIRVWATWAAFGNDVSAVDRDGTAREGFLKKLRWLVAECDRRGLVVDVTLSRGNGVTGPPRLQTLGAHRRAAVTLATALRPYRNWYLDLGNERNLRDKRFVSFADLAELRRTVKKLDPDRLVTASHAGDIPAAELRDYLRTARVDFLSPHRPRNAGSPRQTEKKSREYLAAMKAVGRVVPLHYQEPFRRGFGKWQPTAEDYVTDACGARAGGAAGWCFHNGHQGSEPDGRPRRSFDLRKARLFEQLDPEEQKALKGLKSLPAR
jgi:endo-1,4-beta-mannosidase